MGGHVFTRYNGDFTFRIDRSFIPLGDTGTKSSKMSGNGLLKLWIGTYKIFKSEIGLSKSTTAWIRNENELLIFMNSLN